MWATFRNPKRIQAFDLFSAVEAKKKKATFLPLCSHLHSPQPCCFALISPLPQYTLKAVAPAFFFFLNERLLPRRTQTDAIHAARETANRERPGRRRDPSQANPQRRKHHSASTEKQGSHAESCGLRAVRRGASGRLICVTEGL